MTEIDGYRVYRVDVSYSNWTSVRFSTGSCILSTSSIGNFSLGKLSCPVLLLAMRLAFSHVLSSVIRWHTHSRRALHNIRYWKISFSCYKWDKFLLDLPHEPYREHEAPEHEYSRTVLKDQWFCRWSLCYFYALSSLEPKLNLHFHPGSVMKG